MQSDLPYRFRCLSQSFLHPLVHPNTGQVPPNFPRNLIELHLLSQDILDDLGLFYNPETACYPIFTPSWVGKAIGEQRRLFARFIGLKFNPNDVPNITVDIQLLLQKLGLYNQYREE